MLGATLRTCPCPHPVYQVGHHCRISAFMQFCGRPPGLIYSSRFGLDHTYGRVASSCGSTSIPLQFRFLLQTDGGTTLHVLAHACSMSHQHLSHMLALQITRAGVRALLRSMHLLHSLQSPSTAALLSSAVPCYSVDSMAFQLSAVVVLHSLVLRGQT